MIFFWLRYVTFFEKLIACILNSRTEHILRFTFEHNLYSIVFVNETLYGYRGTFYNWKHILYSYIIFLYFFLLQTFIKQIKPLVYE